MDMTRRRKTDEALAGSEVVEKLDRLLRTETMLEAMLDETRQEALKVVEAARKEAEVRVRRFEANLESEHRELRERIEQEVEEAIRAIKSEADAETARLEQTDDQSVDRLARHVVDSLIGSSVREEES